MAKSALVGLAGTVAIGAATRVAGQRAQRRHRRRFPALKVSVPKVATPKVSVPKELRPENLAAHIDFKKLAGRVDHKDLIRRVGDAAELIERHSDEVRQVSGQAKRISRKLS